MAKRNKLRHSPVSLDVSRLNWETSDGKQTAHYYDMHPSGDPDSGYVSISLSRDPDGTAHVVYTNWLTINKGGAPNGMGEPYPGRVDLKQEDGTVQTYWPRDFTAPPGA